MLVASLGRWRGIPGQDRCPRMRPAQLLPLRRRVDGLQSSCYGLAVLVAGKAHGMAQQVDDARLHLRLWKGRLDGLGEALEAIHDRDQNVLDAPVALIVQDLGPEFGALIGLKPKARRFFPASMKSFDHL